MSSLRRMVESSRKRTRWVAVTILVISCGTVSFIEMVRYRCRSTNSCRSKDRLTAAGQPAPAGVRIG